MTVMTFALRLCQGRVLLPECMIDHISCAIFFSHSRSRKRQAGWGTVLPGHRSDRRLLRKSSWHSAGHPFVLPVSIATPRCHCLPKLYYCGLHVPLTCNPFTFTKNGSFPSIHLQSTCTWCPQNKTIPFHQTLRKFLLMHTIFTQPLHNPLSAGFNNNKDNG